MSEAGRTFSCRIYGVLREGEKVLLTRSAFRGSSFINFPGGGVDIGEAPMSALLREFVEETGLVVRPLRTLYASEGAHLSTQAPIQIVSAYWLVERVSGGSSAPEATATTSSACSGPTLRSCRQARCSRRTSSSRRGSRRCFVRRGLSSRRPRAILNP